MRKLLIHMIIMTAMISVILVLGCSGNSPLTPKKKSAVPTTRKSKQQQTMNVDTEIPQPQTPPPSLLIAPFNRQTAAEKQQLWSNYLGQKIIETNSINIKMVLIPPGEFKMGSGKSIDELAILFKNSSIETDPGKFLQHKVRITKPFYIASTEVTQGQWKSIMGTTPWKNEYQQLKYQVKENDDYAASYLSWEDAQEFITKLNIKENVTYRLPTEAEWEYACRAGSESMYCFGDSFTTLKEYAWFSKGISTKNEIYPHQVGILKSNDFGLYDMHGNVWEWCADWYQYGYKHFDDQTAIDPLGTHTNKDYKTRVKRGGSCDSPPSYCRSIFRGRDLPHFRLKYGIRLVRTP